MKYKFLVAVLLICASPVAESDGQSLHNERYGVSVQDASTISILETSAGSWLFDLDFTVFEQATDPQMSMQSVDLGGARYRVPQWKLPAGGTTFDLFEVGTTTTDLSATSVSFDGTALSWSFASQPNFDLSARLSLPTADGPPALSFAFTPQVTGYYGIGYTGAPAAPLAAVDEIWQPLVWQEARFPEASYLTPAYQATVPSALVTREGVTVGVVVDPAEFAFNPLPLLENSRFGVAVRDRDGQARPMVFAPMLGGAGSRMQAGETYEFTMRPSITPGETEEAFENIARQLYGFRDYRHNDIASLNTTLDNMVSYGLSNYSNFVEEYKGASFQNDVPGGVKNNSSLDALGVAMLTDNPQIFDQRAYPTLEYMLSRNNLLFEADDQAKDLSGPAAPVSELAALHTIFNGATNLLQGQAIQKYVDTRGGDVYNPDPWGKFYQSLYLYELTGDTALLNKAIVGADQYIADRIDTPQTTFRETNGAGMFFWNTFVPDFAHLYELYERTGEQRFLDASHESARRFAQFVWMAPSIPEGDILVNEGDEAPVYWAHSGKPPIPIPAELAPAWRLSEVGLTPEGSGTAHGHRAIFMAQFAPWLLRIGHDSDDLFLQEIARSAIIGRYANFPGYHINTARTTVYEKEDYPLHDFDDLSYNSFHYNHVWPAMTQILDFLVSEAKVLSDSAIDFPSELIDGGAYFQSKFYGGKTGQFYDYDDAVLWMPAGLAEFDSVEVNYISARGDDRLYMALMNTLDQPLTTTFTLDPTLLPQTVGQSFTAELWLNDQVSTPVNVVNGQVTLTLPAKGLASLAIDGLTAPTQLQDNIMGVTNAEAWDADLVQIDDLGGRGMVLNLGQTLSTAFVYLTDSRNDYDAVTLHYSADGSNWQTASDSAYPFEFTVPLSAGVSGFDFYVEGLDSSGQTVDQSQSYRMSQFAVGAERTWEGTTGTGTWDIATSQHWREGNQLFADHHRVTFNDQASNAKLVHIPAPVEPLSVTIDTNDSYAFSGPGAIVGSGSLTKTGSGTASFNNPLRYTGETIIEEGVLQLTGATDSLGSSRIVVQEQATLDVGGTNAGRLTVANQSLDVGGQVVGDVTAGDSAIVTIAGDGQKTVTSQSVILMPPHGTMSNASDVRTLSGAGHVDDTFDLAMGSVKALSVFRSLLAFDLSSTGITDPSFIDKVNLTLKLNSPNGAQVDLVADPTLELHQIGSYDSDVVTFATQPAFSNLIASITGPNFASGYAGGDTIEWTEQSAGAFIDAVKNALGGHLYLGTKVDDTSENAGARSFYFVGSAEDSGKEPILEITFTDPSAGTSGMGAGWISGDYDQSATATLQVDLYHTSLYDQLTVGGSATLDGILDVRLLPGFVPSLGDSFQFLIAAAGVTGTFASEALPDLGPLLKLRDFYEANAVTLAVVPALDGDYNADGVVNLADYTIWRDTLGSVGTGLAADGDGTGVVDHLDYQLWRANFGLTLNAAAERASVPEPATCWITLWGVGLLLASQKARKHQRVH